MNRVIILSAVTRERVEAAVAWTKAARAAAWAVAKAAEDIGGAHWAVDLMVAWEKAEEAAMGLVVALERAVALEEACVGNVGVKREARASGEIA